MTTTLVSDDQLIELLESVWSSMLGLPLYSAQATTQVLGSSRLTVSIHISGGWNGTVLLQLTERFARRAAALMLGATTDKVAEADVHDAAAELCNIVGGGLKSLLPGPSALSLPSVINGSDYLVRIARARLVTEIELLCEGQPVNVRMLEAIGKARDPQAAP